MKKNIGIFTQDFFPIFGGQGMHVYQIYKKFIKLNFTNFFIFSPNKNNIKNNIFIEKSFLKNIGLSVKIYKKINNFIKQYNLGLLHFHGGPGGIFFFKKLNIPVVYTAHHTYWQQYNYVKGEKWKKIFYYFEKLSYKNASKIICVSEDTKNVIKNNYGIEEKKLVYIPNGINLEDFKINPNIKKEKKSLVFVGRLDGRKGIEFLVKTMEKVVKKDNKIKLYIIGDGVLKNKLQEFIKINNLEKNIIFTGRLNLEDLKNRIQRSEIMITPSVFEGFGISVLEGMALKVPIIGTNVDGIRTIIQDGNNGLLVEYGNKKQLSSKILELLNDKNLQEKFIKNAYNDLQIKYDWNLITKKTIDVYEKLV